MRLTFLTLVLILIAVGPLHASEVRSGRFQLTFSERSPWAAWSELATRYGWGDPTVPYPSESDYDLAKEPYDVYVPKDYDGSVAYGLIAYINAGNGGGNGNYNRILDQHRLIWIGGTKLENARGTSKRMGLTIDAVHNMRQRYRIDPERIYVCGTSGGGRLASLMGVTYADVFTGGGIYLIGCNLPVWPADKAAAERVRALAAGHRFAFMTGSKDFNREGTQQVFAAYQAAKLPLVKYFETPDHGHGNPPGEWFAQALDFVDAPLIARATAAYERGETLSAAKGKRLEAYAAYRDAAALAIATDIVAKAQPKLDDLRRAIDIDLAKDLELLLTTPTSEKLRAFAARWAEFPSGAAANGHADRLGAGELDALLAKDAKLTLTPLRAFVRTWDGYPVRERALAALEVQAQAALTSVLALTPPERRLRALAKFASEWTPTSAAAQAAKLLDEGLDAELATIQAEPKPLLRGQKLRTFAKAWPGTAAASTATRVLGELAAELEKAGAKP